MELEELKSIWSDYDKKVEKSLNLNRKILKNIKLEKAKSTFNKLVWLRMVEAFCFLTIVAFLGRFIAANFSATAPVVSAVILDCFALIGFIGCIKQIVLIKQINFAGSILSIQKQIEEIKLHSLQVFKLLLLSAPFYMAYVFLSFEVLFDLDLYSTMQNEDVNIIAIASAVFAVPTIWFYTKLNIKKMNNNWIKKIIDEVGGMQLKNAVDFLNDAKEFESEN